MEKQPFLFAVSGVKNSGKTTLITKLIPIFVKYGLKVASVKHDGHDFDADVPGTDSYRHMKAGAYGTAVFSASKYMVVKKQEHTTEEQLVRLFPEADLILLEGFKKSPYPKIEIVRKGNSEAPVCTDESLTAVAADFPFAGAGGVPADNEAADNEAAADEAGSREMDGTGKIRVLDLNHVEEIAEHILDVWFIRTKLAMAVLAGGMSRRMGCDKADLLCGEKTFLQIQIEKGKRLGIEEILVSGYRGSKCVVPVIRDRYPDRGPLGGLEATLREVKKEFCLVMTVDVPMVTEELLQQLVRVFRHELMNSDEAKTTSGAGLSADGGTSRIMIVEHGERQEPLLGIYSTDLADRMEQELREGKGSMFHFLETQGYDVYKSREPEEIFENINTPESYRRIHNYRTVDMPAETCDNGAAVMSGTVWKRRNTF